MFRKLLNRHRPRPIHPNHFQGRLIGETGWRDGRIQQGRECRNIITASQQTHIQKLIVMQLQTGQKTPPFQQGKSTGLR